MLVGLWEKRFSELAAFNSERDKTKFADWYIEKMAAMQKEYDDKLKRLAIEQGHIVI